LLGCEKFLDNLLQILLQLSQNLTNYAFEIHDRQITLLLSKGRKAQEEIQKLNGKSVNEKVIHFADLGTALIQAREQGKDPFELRAIDTIKEMNSHNKRKVPEGAPLDFVSSRWQKHVYDDDGNVNRQYYEMAVLTELRNLVRSGNVSIKGSRQHQDFDNYLVAKETWEQNKHLNELTAPLFSLGNMGNLEKEHYKINYSVPAP
jgi:hypothetical protein